MGLPPLTLAGRELSPAVYRWAVLNLSHHVSIPRRGKIYIIKASLSALEVKITKYSFLENLVMDRKQWGLRLKQNSLLQRGKLCSGLTSTFFLRIIPSQTLIDFRSSLTYAQVFHILMVAEERMSFFYKSQVRGTTWPIRVSHQRVGSESVSSGGRNSRFRQNSWSLREL